MRGAKGIQFKLGQGAQTVAVGALTGLFAGTVVTLFNVLVTMTEEFARGYFGYIADHPAFIPLLFLALFSGSIVIGGVLRFLPMLRGSGFAQTEGATSGRLRFKWYRDITSMFAASLFTIFMGLSAGAEGPSVFIGGACGSGVSDLLRRDPTVRRYQITGGACAGLAVGLNAPLTGIIFAYEEAHKRFTPEVFVCSFTSVIFAVVVRNLLRGAMGLSVGAFLPTVSLPADAGLIFCLFALGAALVVSLVGVGFYRLLLLVKRLFSRITFWKNMGKCTIPFLLAGVFGLITVLYMGSGEELISMLGSGGEPVSVFGAPLIASLFIILLLKFIATAVNTGAELPCCASIPMLAMGAILGRLLAMLFGKMGMDPAFTDALMVLCMVTFFTSVVKAPITGIIMTVELTWNFSFLLPAVVCSAIAYLVGDVFHTMPLYEKLLEGILEEQGEEGEKVEARVRVLADAPAAERTVRDVLWPFSALVKGVEREGHSFAPTGETVLKEGDILLIEGTPVEREEFLRALSSTAGELLPASAEAPPAEPSSEEPPADEPSSEEPPKDDP